MNSIIKRFINRYPENLLDTFNAKIKWILFGIYEDSWVYGICNGKKARKHKIKGNVQFVLWKAGEAENNEDYWHDFDCYWWEYFKT